MARATGRGEEEYLLAKTYYSISRFPDALTPLKAEVSADCVRAYLKAAAHLDPPLQRVEVLCDGKAIPCHYRVPKGASPSSPVAAVLIMCGADVFKEDRGWAAEYALASGLASLVMDAPGPTRTPSPTSRNRSRPGWRLWTGWPTGPRWPRTVSAHSGSAGGYSVMQLAGTYPERVAAAVAIAGNHFGYRMSPEEAEAFVEMQNVRSTYVFGAPGDGPTFKPTTLEGQEELFRKWSLTDLGLADAIVCPVLMINGKRDHLAPIGNIYDAGARSGHRERGPVYPDDGHCAFKHRPEWGPEVFDWLARRLA